MAYGEQAADDKVWATRAEKAHLMRLGGRLLTLALVGLAVWWIVPWPDDPGVGACADIRAHAAAGTAPDAAQRADIIARFEDSDEEVLRTAAREDPSGTARLMAMAGYESGYDPADYGLLYTACTDAGLL